MIARTLQITLAVALIWLLAAPLPQARERHWTYRPCDLIVRYCTIS